MIRLYWTFKSIDAVREVEKLRGSPAGNGELRHVPRSLRKLGNVPMSQAYASALNISLEVRGGLPVCQILHWAGDLMLVSIMARLLRVFFTGAHASRARSRG